MQTLWQATGLIVASSRPDTDIASKLATQPAHFLVAEQRGAVVGTCMGGFEGRRGWLNWLCVAHGARGRGIGRALVEAVEARLRAVGAAKVNLQVRDTNAAVLAFYAGLGYRREALASMGKRFTP